MQSLDIFDKLPKGMRLYLSHYGWHFSREACAYAVSMLRKGGERIEPLGKERVDELLSSAGIELQGGRLYDYVYVANKAKAQLWKSSIEDEKHFAAYIRDVVDGQEADGVIMRCWYAGMVAAGEPIEWEDLL